MLCFRVCACVCVCVLFVMNNKGLLLLPFFVCHYLYLLWITPSYTACCGFFLSYVLKKIAWILVMCFLCSLFLLKSHYSGGTAEKLN
jgi:hypothetical protein